MDYRLILVNKEHKIEKDFIEKVTLIKVKDVNDEDIMILLKDMGLIMLKK